MEEGIRQDTRSGEAAKPTQRLAGLLCPTGPCVPCGKGTEVQGFVRPRAEPPRLLLGPGSRAVAHGPGARLGPHGEPGTKSLVGLVD